MTRRAWRTAAFAAALVAAAAAAVLLRPSAPLPPSRWMEEAGLIPRHATVHGLRLRYLRHGSGPAVILLHGFASSAYTWKDVVGPLAARHDVVAVDLPGFGASDIPDPLRADVFPAVVFGLADQIGLPRFALVGNSLGGAVAVAAAVRDPARVDRLVLVDAAGFNFAPEDRPPLLRLLGSPLGAMVERLPVGGRVLRAGLRQVFHDDTRVTDERVAEYLRPYQRPGAVRASRQVLSSPDQLGFPGIVSRVRTPTLVVWGRQDRWIPVAHAARFERAIPGATVHVIEACGHLPQEERPADFLAAVEPFLAQRAEKGEVLRRVY